MWNVERLRAEDYDELLDFLNRAFGHGAENSFDKILPVMWRRDEEHMGKHLAIRDGGKIVAALGVYPLRVRVAGQELLFATCGNVGTDAAYRGRGCMKALMEAAMEELDRIGADAVRLGGQRQRYERYGFVPVGIKRIYELNQKNVADKVIPQVSFRPIARTDAEALAFAAKLQRAKPFYVERGDADSFYDIMCAWNNRPFLAVDGEGKNIGVLSVSPDNTEIAEQYAVDAKAEYAILQSWMMQNSLWSVSCTAQPWDRDFIRLIGADCESMKQTFVTQCKIIHWNKICNALLGLYKDAEIPSGSFTLEIKDSCFLRFEGRSCRAVDSAIPDLSLDDSHAARFLFGYEQPGAVCALPPQKAAWIRAVFPLPFGWNGQDRV